jgi:glutaredoxin
LRDRDAFYKKIQKHTKIKYIHFPMIFKDAKFVGGYKELIS